MSVDPNAPSGTLGAGDIYRIGKAYYESARSAIEDITGGKPSKREEAILREAGYRYVDKGTKLERGWVDPSGRGITADEAAKRADRLKDVKRAAAGGVYIPTKEEIREAERREREADKAAERAKRERQARTPDAKRPQGRVGRIIDAATAVLIGTGVIDVIKNPPLPDIPPPPPPDPGMGSPGEFDLPPKSQPWNPPPVIVPPTPAPPAPPKAAPVDKSTWEPLLLPVPVYSAPIPVPAPVPAPPAPASAMPGGAPVTSAPTPPTAPLWKQALPFVLPLALSALTVPSGGARRRRDPLTVPQTPTLGSLQPTLASYPLPFPGSGFGGSGASTSETCACKPKGPRKRRRKRTVCYSGTYTEKASGIRKVKKRKVPCR